MKNLIGKTLFVIFCGVFSFQSWAPIVVEPAPIYANLEILKQSIENAMASSTRPRVIYANLERLKESIDQHYRAINQEGAELEKEISDLQKQLSQCRQQQAGRSR